MYPIACEARRLFTDLSIYLYGRPHADLSKIPKVLPKILIDCFLKEATFIKKLGIEQNVRTSFVGFDG